MPRCRARTVPHVAGVLAAWAIGCGDLGGFACVEDDQCRRDGVQGICAPLGYCAYPDDACDSGHRYSPDAANAVAGTCTEPDPPPGGSTTGAPADDTTGTTAAPNDDGDTSTDGGSSSTGSPPLPLCGDGNVDEGEECDDADDERGDGCNPDCRISGVAIASFRSMLPDDDAARDLLRLDGDVIVAGEWRRPDEGLDGLVTRYAPDGSTSWSTPITGGAHVDDRATAIARSPTGTLRVAGAVVPTASGMTTPRAQIWLAEVDAVTGAIVWDVLDGAAPPSSDQAWDLLVPSDDTLLVTGRLGPTATQDFFVRRYAVATVDGATQVDEVWTELVQGAADGADYGFALVVDLAGRLVAGGTTRATDTDLDRHLEAFALDGGAARPPCLDDGSDADQRVDDGNDQIRGLALAPDGRIVAAGLTTKSAAQGIDAWVGVYEPDGCALVWERTVPGRAGERDEAHAVAVDTDGTIVTVGYVRDTNSDDIWVAKWDALGELRWQADPINGPGDGNDGANAVVLDGDGTIVVAGYIRTPTDNDQWVGWFTP